MGLFSGLFGSSEQETEIPSWVRGPAEEMLQRSLDMGKAGYMPWTGPDVAALDRAQIASMRNTHDMASAFGMNAAMPKAPGATDFGGGIWGYSSKPLYDQNLATLREERPGQMAYYDGFFVDPMTGADGAQVAQTAQPQGDYWSEDARRQRAIDDVLYGHLGGMAGENHQQQMAAQNAAPQQSGGMFGGYTGLGDMFDGGGPGVSGESFGGLLGGFSNARGRKPGQGLLGGLF